jgi:anaerobic magnesium-protoporphyrin IX monomethyl ester cyclase
MKILLVDPPIEQIVDSMPYKEGPAFAIGLLSLDSYLEKHGYHDIELENYFKCDWNEIGQRLRHTHPDIIGIGCTTDSRGFCWQLAKVAKGIYPDVKVVLGNVHATFFHRQILEHYPIDFCVLSEGEETMLELVRAIEADKRDYGDILGLAWRDAESGEIIMNGQRPLMRDLDNIPINPKRRVFLNVAGKRQGNMMSSRGCPFACGFCSSSAFWLGTWRKHSVQHVVDEFEMLVEQGAEVIDILDDLFTTDFERAETICDLLIRKGNKTPWYARARVDRITEGLVDKMVAAGCKEISFGIESGDPEMIKRINKRINLEQAVEVFQMLGRKKLIARANFMVGNPGETLESVEASIRLIRRMNPPSIIASIAIVYPNTMLDREAQKHGLIKPEFWYLDTAPAPYYTVDMPYEQLQALATGMLFKWAVHRGPAAMAKMVYEYWKISGTRRSLSFILSWARSWLPWCHVKQAKTQI